MDEKEENVLQSSTQVEEKSGENGKKKEEKSEKIEKISFESDSEATDSPKPKRKSNSVTRLQAMEKLLERKGSKGDEFVQDEEDTTINNTTWFSPKTLRVEDDTNLLTSEKREVFTQSFEEVCYPFLHFCSFLFAIIYSSLSQKKGIRDPWRRRGCKDSSERFARFSL